MFCMDIVEVLNGGKWRGEMKWRPRRAPTVAANRGPLLYFHILDTSLCTSTQPPTHPGDACVRRVFELFRRILRRYDRAGCRIKSILNVLLELPAVTTKRFFRRENLQHGAAASRAVCCCCCWNSANDADVCFMCFMTPRRWNRFCNISCYTKSHLFTYLRYTC